MKTTLVTYYFDTSKPDQESEWHKLRRELEKTTSRCHEVIAMGPPSGLPRGCDGGPVDLDTAHLFDNQWNTTEGSLTESGARVFDWYLGVCPNRAIKAGHYLIQTPEMDEARLNRRKCGYCGYQAQAQQGYVFCPKPSCIGSEYLKETRLHLTRMGPLDSHHTRKPLTDAERDHLLPQYVTAQTQAQTTAAKSRALAQKEKMLAAAASARLAADAWQWMADNGVSVEPLYYDHNQRFCFGWRSPLSWSVVSAILGWVSEFPAPYEIKGVDADGNERTWEGY